MDLLVGCRNFIFKLFTKERRESLEFSEIFALLSMTCFSCLIIVGKTVNLLLTFAICMIFKKKYFHVILALEEIMAEVVSFGIRRSFLIVLLFLLNISWRTLLIKKIFWLRLLCSFSLLCIDLRIPIVTHGFLSACGNPLLNNLVCATKFKKVCCLSFTKQISRLGRLLR